MTAQADLLRLLRSRAPNWVSRDDINFTGGEAADRRMRELREQLASAGEFRLDERRDRNNRLEYRLVEVPRNESEKDRAERTRWRCTHCGSHPLTLASTQPSMDPRWRLGKCVACRKRTIYKQAVES